MVFTCIYTHTHIHAHPYAHMQVLFITFLVPWPNTWQESACRTLYLGAWFESTMVVKAQLWEQVLTVVAEEVRLIAHISEDQEEDQGNANFQLGFFFISFQSGIWSLSKGLCCLHSERSSTKPCRTPHRHMQRCFLFLHPRAPHAPLQPIPCPIPAFGSYSPVLCRTIFLYLRYHMNEITLLVTKGADTLHWA